MKLPFSRVLITGGAGFIGSHLVDALIRLDCQVTVLDNFSTGSSANLMQSKVSKNFTLLKGDITNIDDIRQSMKDVEVVFHEAAVVSVWQSVQNPSYVMRVNVEGTVNLLRCAENTQVSRFIFASSAAIYGNPPFLPVREDSKLCPISPYGESKLEAERKCLDSYATSGLAVTALRYFNAYGPRSNNGPYSGVITKFAQRLSRKEAPIIFGNGKQTRDFVHVSDIISANVEAASNRGAVGRSFNVGTGRPTTIEQLALIESDIILNKNLLIPFDYRPALPSDIVHSYADISLIKEELGFEPQYTLENGLVYLKDMKSDNFVEGPIMAT